VQPQISGRGELLIVLFIEGEIAVPIGAFRG
jgi:hypothetical protein